MCVMFNSPLGNVNLEALLASVPIPPCTPCAETGRCFVDSRVILPHAQRGVGGRGGDGRGRGGNRQRWAHTVVGQ